MLQQTLAPLGERATSGASRVRGVQWDTTRASVVSRRGTCEASNESKRICQTSWERGDGFEPAVEW